jgi:predicted ABC-type ATPase
VIQYQVVPEPGAVARVAERVRQGGRHIPQDVIRRRFFAGLRRAGELARQTAIQTNTNLVVMRSGKLIRIPAKALWETAANGAGRKK